MFLAYTERARACVRACVCVCRISKSIIVAPVVLIFLQSSVDAPSCVVVECQAQECPAFLIAGFLELFVGLPVDTGKLTMVTLTEHTTHDMMEWSQAMAQEREELLHHVRSCYP